MSINRILVTGGTGLLGSNTIRELLNRNYELNVLIHRNNGMNTLKGLDLQHCPGSLQDTASLAKAAEGCEAIVHIAAHTEVWPSKGSIFQEVNVQGTQNLIDLALRQEIERFIHVGSANSFVFGSKDSPGTEKKIWQNNPYGLDYIHSKAKAQQLVLKATEEQGLPGVVVNPTFMLGPYDSKPSSGAMLLALARKKLPGYTQGGKNWVYVKDVAWGICQALTLGKIGECYILGHENLTYQEALTRMAEAIGVPKPRYKIPNYALKLFGRVGSSIGYLSEKNPPISYPMAKIACEGHYYSAQKAIKELDLPQTPIEEAALEAFNWFNHEGYL